MFTMLLQMVPNLEARLIEGIDKDIILIGDMVYPSLLFAIDIT
jgi:hypothetical protein